MARKRSKKQILAVVPQQPQQRRTSRKRRRNRRAGARAVTRMGMGVPRSKFPTTRDGANFLRAALDPFADVSLRSVGVPDTFAGDTLKHCNTMELTLKPNSSGVIQFTIMPSASHPLVFSRGHVLAFGVPQYDKTSHNFIGSTTIADLDVDNIWTGYSSYPSIPWPSWVGVPTNSGPYAYKSQRVVSMGLEWRYTGTELNDKGVCTAAILDAFSLPGYLEKPADGSAPASASSLMFLNRYETTNLLLNDETSLSNQPRYVQQTLHSSEGSGGMIVLVSGEEGYQLVPTNSNVALYNSTEPLSNWAGGGGGYTTVVGLGIDNDSPTQGYVRGPIIPPQNLRPVGVAFTGLDPANCSIVLKIKQRVEATVDVYSPFQQFTDKSPVEDQMALDLAADIAKTLPVMVPVTMNGFGDWWRKIMGKIGSLGKIVGGMRIPMVSTVAGGVGDIAEILGSFADL